MSDKDEPKLTKNADRQPTKVAWTLWGLFTFFYAYQYIIRVLPAYIVQDIMLHFNITAQDFGIFSSIYYIGYSLIHLPVGLYLDKFGVKKIMPFSIFLVSAGLGSLLITENWIIALIGRLLVGIGSSGAALGLLNILTSFFPQKLFNKLLSVSIAIGLASVIFFGRIINNIINQIGWKNLITILSFTGIMLSILVLIIAPNYNKNNDSTSALEKLKSVFTNYKIIIIASAGGLMVGPLEGFCDAWAIEFFKQVYNFNSNVTSNLIPLLFAGMIAGLLIIPTIADKFKIHYPLIILAAIIMAVCLFVILFCNINLLLIKILLFICGVFSCYQSSLLFINSLYANRKAVSLSLALTNMIIMIFGALFHPLIGIIMELHWDGRIINSLHQYSNNAYINSLSIIPIASMLGGIILLITKRKLPKKGNI